MEQLLIFVAIAVISIISNILQNKKKQQEEQEELERRARRAHEQPRGPHSAPPPLTEPSAPTADLPDWQRQFRRMIEEQVRPFLGETPSAPQPPPPVIISQEPSRPSQPLLTTDALQSARKQTERIRAETRKKIEEADRVRKPVRAPIHRRPRGPLPVVERLRRNRDAAREAFIASLIFAPPRSLQNEDPVEMR